MYRKSPSYSFLIFTLIFFFCSFRGNSIRVEVIKPTIPVLINKEQSSTIRLNFIRANKEPYIIKTIKINLSGTTDIKDVVSVSIYGLSGRDNRLDTSMLICKPVPAAENVLFKDEIKVNKDTLSLWVAVKLKDIVSLDHKINVNCTSVETSKGWINILPIKDNPLRIGVSVRKGWQDGVHTSRIPAIATTLKGTLLAAFDARYMMPRDLQGDIDIALHRSFDKGMTWMPMQIVLDMGEWGGLPEKYNGVSDPCILVNENNGDIYIAALWMHGLLDPESGEWIEGLTEESKEWGHQWSRKSSQPGLSVKQTCQFLITKSSDDGATWSKPQNITSKTKRPEWWLYSSTSGHGITLSDGTLVFPTQGRDKNGIPFSNITWSKDNGKTWVASNPAFYDENAVIGNTTECTLVELEDGSLMLNMRDDRNRSFEVNDQNILVNGRRICITSDLGQTWEEHFTSRNALIEPTCSAALHRHKYIENGQEKSILLFSNPSSCNSRTKMTLKVSLDDGKTWPEKGWILYDEYRSAGYSSITSIDEHTIGIFYESSQTHLAFIQVKLEEILSKIRP